MANRGVAKLNNTLLNHMYCLQCYSILRLALYPPQSPALSHVRIENCGENQRKTILKSC
jgi:hypothetical protein